MFSLEGLQKSVNKPKSNLKPKIETDDIMANIKLKKTSLNKANITACYTLDINNLILKHHPSKISISETNNRNVIPKPGNARDAIGIHFIL